MNFFKKIMRFFGLGNSIETIRNTEVPRDDYAYNELRAIKQKEMDRILDKIAAKGIESLTGKEKIFLDKESQNS